jgi:hypothetical protein
MVVTKVQRIPYRQCLQQCIQHLQFPLSIKAPDFMLRAAATSTEERYCSSGNVRLVRDHSLNCLDKDVRARNDVGRVTLLGTDD